MPRLENWILVSRKDLYGNPHQYLLGNVYGHPEANRDSGVLCDGHNIMTSNIVSIDIDEKIAVTKSGTVYELGSRCENKEKI